MHLSFLSVHYSFTILFISTSTSPLKILSAAPSRFIGPSITTSDSVMLVITQSKSFGNSDAAFNITF